MVPEPKGERALRGANDWMRELTYVGCDLTTLAEIVP